MSVRVYARIVCGLNAVLCRVHACLLPVFTSLSRSLSPPSPDQTRQYTIVDADVGCQLRIEYTPVRADGTIGHPINIFTTVPQKRTRRATQTRTHSGQTLSIF